MKTKTMQVVTPDMVRDELRAMASDLGRETKSGGSFGGLSRVAAEIGEARPAISAILRNVQAPSKKVLAYFGLEKADVYVKTESRAGKTHEPTAGSQARHAQGVRDDGEQGDVGDVA